MRTKRSLLKSPAVWIASLCCAAGGLSFLPLMPVASAPTREQVAGSVPSETTRLAEVTLGPTPGRLIPATFMGIAHEWGDAQDIMGSSGTGVNFAYRNLLKGLTSYGSGPIVIRIGGNSTDTSKQPTPTTVRPFAELASATGAHFYLGVNLGAGNVRLAVDQAKAFVRDMPAHSLDAIEIGNEPDSYVDKGMRSAPFPFPTYLKEFDTWRKQIDPLLPTDTRLLGPAWAYPASLSNAQALLDAEHSYLNALSQHSYSGDACHGKVNPEDILLRPKAATDAPLRMSDAVALAHGYHLPFRVDELNSLACGGQDGVSNAFGAALWAIDIMFEFANAGVDGVNWQSPNGAAYSPLGFESAGNGNSRTYRIKTITPLYYAMLFFQAATGKHARLLPVSLVTEANLKAWATLDADSNPRLVVINKDVTAGTINIPLPGYRTASILRLAAPSKTSRSGVTFAGQTMDGSPDGTLREEKQIETVNSAGGAFQIEAPAGSAFIAEFIR